MRSCRDLVTPTKKNATGTTDPASFAKVLKIAAALVAAALIWAIALGPEKRAQRQAARAEQAKMRSDARERALEKLTKNLSE